LKLATGKTISPALKNRDKSQLWGLWLLGGSMVSDGALGELSLVAALGSSAW